MGISATISSDLINVTSLMEKHISVFKYDGAMAKPEIGHNKRRHQRFVCRLLITVSCPELSIEVFGLGDDVSQGGLRLRVSKKTPLPIGATLLLKIKVPCDSFEEYHKKPQIEFRAKVVRIEPHGFNNHYGVNFTGLINAQANRIESLHTGKFI
jgi:hypothetical protein